MKKEYKILKVEEKEIKVSNPDKILYPEQNISKWQFVLACARLAPHIISYSKNRLLTTIRFPDGIHQKSFYQKNAPSYKPEWIKTHQEGNTNYILLNNVATVVWLANLACMEFHLSFNTYDSPTHPSELVFDLDPTVPNYPLVIEVALKTRDVLQKLGLDGVVKTSGASGLQIFVPIVSEYPYELTRKVNLFIAQYLQEKFPQSITLERQKQKRGSKIYFDYLQHWKLKSLIAPYSPRAVPEGRVSVPVSWDELPSLTPNKFTLLNMDSWIPSHNIFLEGRAPYKIDDLIKNLPT